jgi:alpha-glucoside transport system ATP-binding protein
MADLKLTDVAKTYGNAVNVLNDINLDIETGELIVFVGPSGCGKSTLLRMIAGLETISGGELLIDGERMNDVPPAQRGIAMVFQSYALYPHMTVRDNMAFALKLAKKTPKEIDDAVNHAARVLQLEDYLDRLPKALSGGQRQRVGDWSFDRARPQRYTCSMSRFLILMPAFVWRPGLRSRSLKKACQIQR